MSPIITLTTDFGTQDGYVGAMKGKILSICPDASIIDITHNIEPQNILQCSWTLLRSTPHFPENSIHVAVVDPGVGSMRRTVLIKSTGRWYIGPDNGVFSEIIRQFGTDEILDIKKDSDWWKAHHSFDGLALFAPAAAHLAQGLSTQEFCSPISRMLTILPKCTPTLESGSIYGQVLLFDHFGNAITNISQFNLDQVLKSPCSISCQNQHFKLVTHYEQGKETPAIALVNSDGYLELSAYESSAKKKFGLKAGDPVTVQ